MRLSLKHVDRFNQIGKDIRQILFLNNTFYNLKNGKSFYLKTSNKEYWRRMIERDIEDCTIEEWDDGIVIR